MSNDLIKHFTMLSRYNTLANQRLYEACAQLDDDARHQIRPAFFRSIHGTLNHILLGDRIWLGRFAGREMPSTGLDAILYGDFDALWDARRLEDARIAAFTAGLEDAELETGIRYVNNEGRACEDPLPLLLSHLFNHQSHHRGQVHDMLSQTAVAPPSLDLHRVLHPTPQG